MILMGVTALWTEDYIWGARSAEVIEVILDSFPVCRRPTVRYVEDRDLDVGTGTERRQRVPLLGLTLGALAGKHECAHA